MKKNILLLILVFGSIVSLSAQTKWYHAIAVNQVINGDFGEWEETDFDISWEKDVENDVIIVIFHDKDKSSYVLVKEHESEISEDIELQSFYALDGNSQFLYFVFSKTFDGKLYIGLVDDDTDDTVIFEIKEKICNDTVSPE